MPGASTSTLTRHWEDLTFTGGAHENTIAVVLILDQESPRCIPDPFLVGCLKNSNVWAAMYCVYQHTHTHTLLLFHVSSWKQASVPQQQDA